MNARANPGATEAGLRPTGPAMQLSLLPIADAAAASSPTVAQIALLYLQWCERRHKLKPHTISGCRGYAAALEVDVPGLGPLAKIPIADLRPPHIDRWAEWAADERTPPYAPKTIGTIISFLSTVCRWAVQKGWRPGGPNPCKEFSRGAYVPRTEHVAPRQLRDFLDAVHDAEREASMWWREPARSIVGRAPYVLFRLVLVTGARPSELRTATWDEVDLDAKVVRRPTSKTGVPRRIALNEQAIYILAQWRLLLGTHADTRALKHVFPSLRDPTGYLRDYRKAWAHIRKHEIFAGLRLYDLRRTFAVTAIEAGASLEDTAAALGHGPGVLDRCYVPHAARPGAHRAARDAGERMRRYGAVKERLA